MSGKRKRKTAVSIDAEDVVSVSNEIAHGWPRKMPPRCEFCGAEIDLRKCARRDGKVFCPQCHRRQSWVYMKPDDRPVKEVSEEINGIEKGNG